MISAVILGIAMTIHNGKDSKNIPPVLLPKAETSETHKVTKETKEKQCMTFGYSIPGFGISGSNNQCKNPQQNDWDKPYSNYPNQVTQPEVQK